MKGHEGNTVTSHVEDPTVFEHLTVGQTIVEGVSGVELETLTERAPQRRDDDGAGLLA